MNKEKIIYWATTGIIGAMMLFSAYAYMTSPDVKTIFSSIGFPDFFRTELGIAKGLGALALLLPMVPKGLKIFAYNGFIINLVSASYTHMMLGHPMKDIVTPLVILGILSASYYYYLRGASK